MAQTQSVLEIVRESGRSELKFSGRLDAEGVAGAWERALRSVDETKPTLIDASDVEYCDGSGFALLWELKRRTGVEVSGLKPEIAKLLETFGETERKESEKLPVRQSTLEAIGQDWRGSGQRHLRTDLVSRASRHALFEHRASAPSAALAGCLGYLRARGSPGPGGGWLDLFSDRVDHGLSSGTALAAIWSGYLRGQFGGSGHAARIGSHHDGDCSCGTKRIGLCRGNWDDEN